MATLRGALILASTTTLLLLVGSLLASNASAADLNPIPPLPCSDPQNSCPTQVGDSQVLGVDYGLVVGSSGNFGFFQYNGEKGSIDRKSVVFADCQNARRDNLDRAGNNYNLPIIILRSLNPGTYTVKNVYHAPNGATGELSTTFSRSSMTDTCVGPALWTYKGEGTPNRDHQKLTGTWSFDFYVNGIFVDTLVFRETPIGARDAPAWTNFAVVDDDCSTGTASYVRTESAFAVRVGWDNWGSGTAHPFRVMWVAPSGSTWSVQDSWAANDFTTKCVKQPIDSSNRDLIGTWKVRAYIEENGATFDCGRDAYTTCLSPSWEKTFTLVNRVPSTPPAPTGESFPFRNTAYNYCLSSVSDPDGDTIRVSYSWSDGVTDSKDVASGATNVCTSRTFTSLGEKTLTVKLCDKFNSWTDCSGTSSKTVTVVNRAPAFKVGMPTVTPTTTFRGVTVTGQGDATDADGDQYKCTFIWGDTTSSTSGLVNSGAACSQTHQYGALGTFRVTSRVTDTLANGDSAETLAGDVIVQNRAPSTPAAPTSADTTFFHHTTYTFSVANPSDPDGTYDRIRCEFNWGDGTTTVTAWLTQPASSCSAQHAWLAPGSYTIRVLVRDEPGLASSESTKAITVGNRLPTHVSGSVSPSSIGRNGQTTATATGRDPEGDQVKCLFNWGDGSLETEVGPVNSDTACSASHTYGTTITRYTITVRYKDTWAASAYPATGSTVGTLDVVNLAPVSTTDPACTPSAPHKSSMSCTFTLSDPDAMDQTGGTISWGDGSALEDIPVGSNGRQVTRTHTYAAPGVFEIKYKVRDNVNPSLESGWSRPFLHQATNTGPSPTSASCSPLGPQPRGVTVTCRFAATDAENDNVRFLVNWGDGASTWTGFVAPGALVTVSHQYPTAASAVGQTYDIVATAADTWDSGGSIGGGSLNIVNRLPGKPTVTATPNPTYRNTEVQLSVAATDPDGDKVRYTISYGDGTASETSPFVTSGSTYTFRHKFTALGTYCVRATAADELDSGSPSPQSDCANVVIENKAPVAVISSKNPFAGDNVFLAAPNSASFSAANSHDDDGDGITGYNWSVYLGTPATGAKAADDQSTVDANFPLPPGSYTVVLKVRDGLGLWSAPAEFSFVVV